MRGIGEVVRASFGNENVEMFTLLALRGSGLICAACTPMCACALFESRRDYSLSSHGLSGN